MILLPVTHMNGAEGNDKKRRNIITDEVKNGILSYNKG